MSKSKSHPCKHPFTAVARNPLGELYCKKCGEVLGHPTGIHYA